MGIERGGGNARAGDPLIGITMDVSEPSPGRPRVECSLAYSAAVARAGGCPVHLAPNTGLVAGQIGEMDGFILTGGDDPRMEPFGEPTHPRAKPMHPLRQEYETRLIRELLARPEVPVLGICLGMQMLALLDGGKLDQHLPDHLPSAGDHRDGRVHGIRPEGATWLTAGGVASFHRQAVSDPGSMRIVARGEDGVIEAIERPDAQFCLGVQWHPERTEDFGLGDGLFVRFIQAAREWRSTRAARS
jgi:putative glutamine amidotransferase